MEGMSGGQLLSMMDNINLKDPAQANAAIQVLANVAGETTPPPPEFRNIYATTQPPPLLTSRPVNVVNP
jgi:hypothetical protein